MQEVIIARPSRRAQAPVHVEVTQDGARSRASEQLAMQVAKRDELKSQLESLTERRHLITEQMRHADAPAQRELQGRLRAIDERSGRIENELNSIDDAIAAAIEAGAQQPPSGFDRLIKDAWTTTPAPGFAPDGLFGRDTSNLMVSVLVGQAVGFALLGLVLWTALRRRVSAALRLGPEDVSRLDQLQRSVDVMAVEMERVSEAQRYVSKMLHDKAIGAGAAEGIPLRNDAERVGERGAK